MKPPLTPGEVESTDSNYTPPRSGKFLKTILRGFRVLLLVVVPLVALLHFLQRKLIYIPRQYPPSLLQDLPDHVIPLEFKSGAGKQYAFYVSGTRPEPGKPPNMPRDLWIVFGGNASLALDWLDMVQAESRTTATGFLLVDYPGYGLCEGSPSREGIRDNALLAYGKLHESMGWEFTTRSASPLVHVAGHSLGAAVALEFAVRQPVQDIVLLAPFTSMQEMARLVVGWPLCLLVLDRFDNSDQLRKLNKMPDPPRVTILHGNRDEIIPVTMGRKLASTFPALVAYVEINGDTHNEIPSRLQDYFTPPRSNSPQAQLSVQPLPKAAGQDASAEGIHK